MAVLVGGGELAQEVRDSWVVVKLESVVQRQGAFVRLGEQGWWVVTGQELGGGGIGVELGSVV